MTPDIGSTWKARDGRIMRVQRIVPPGIGQDHSRAVMAVLNPGHRMKGFTEISCAYFVGKKPFLVPHKEDDR
jgi:hypothetical protein